MIRDPYRCWPTRRESSNLVTATRRRDVRAIVRRAMRRDRVVSAAIERVRHAGEDHALANREGARVMRMLHASEAESYAKGHRDGDAFSQSLSVPARREAVA